MLTGSVQTATNNQMELQAAISALAALTRPCEVTIYTDSQYLAQAFNANWLKGWKSRGWVTAEGKAVKNADLWKQLLELTSKHVVTWKWLRGHNEHPENERCDQLAVAARVRLAEQS